MTDTVNNITSQPKVNFVTMNAFCLCSRRFILYSAGSVLWNSLPTYIKLAFSKHRFKN